jgi:hypothetical protein
MVEDVLKALRVFDGREPAMGRAWLTMNNLKKHIFNLQNPPFNLPARIATTLEENFTKRCSRNTREWRCETCIEQGGA